MELLEDHIIEQKPSKNGKYTSLTSRKILNSSDEVIAVYQKVSQIEGVITL
jgi:putative lipoic acid-binding regulatory protein